MTLTELLIMTDLEVNICSTTGGQVCASIAKAELKDDSGSAVLVACAEFGSKAVDALQNLVITMSNKLLVIKAMNKDRKEIMLPNIRLE